MIFRTEMKGGNQKDSSDESRGTPFGVRTSNRASIPASGHRRTMGRQSSSVAKQRCALRSGAYSKCSNEEMEISGYSGCRVVERRQVRDEREVLLVEGWGCPHLPRGRLTHVWSTYMRKFVS